MGEGTQEARQQREAGGVAEKPEIRGFLLSDLSWLKPIAEKYGEWLPFLKAMSRPLKTWVIAPEAIMAIYETDDGLEMAGMCERGSLRALIACGQECHDFAVKNRLTVHTHVSGGWQKKLFEQYGFRPVGDRLVLETR